MQDQVGAVEGGGEERFVALEFQFVRHDIARVGEHAVRGDDDITFDTQRRHDGVSRTGYSETVWTTLETGRELTVGSFRSLTMSSSYCAIVCTGVLARIATTL